MAHKHSVYDTDTHFIIDGVTRVVKNASQTKTMLVQHDHNSERFTFEIPRMVDGHDMSACNSVQVHYINIDSTDKTKKNTGVYEVTDLQISPDSNDVVICSWLISGNATKYVGNLSFVVRFACVSEGTLDYAWHTAAHSAVSVSTGIYNGEAVVEEYVDVLEQWRQELFSADVVELEARTEALEASVAAIHMATDEIYFDITADGIISLKREYRGACTGSSYTFGHSDNGKGIAGTRNKELPEEIIIPDTVNGIAVTELATAMFMSNDRVKRIVLPQSVTVIPKAFCARAHSLEEVNCTKNIKTMNGNAFALTNIRKAYFPSLVQLNDSNHFMGCANLVVADLGSVFATNGSVVPKQCFSCCEKLEYIRNADGITGINAAGLYLTYRLCNKTFLPNLKDIGNSGLLLSRADYDWEKLTGCWFDVMSTSRDVNNYDYSGCTFNACNNVMRSTFSQHNPLWAEKIIVSFTDSNGTDRACKYDGGCQYVSAAMIYSALMGVDMESPEEFVELALERNPELQYKDVADYIIGTNAEEIDTNSSDLLEWLDAVGLHGEFYRSPTPDNVQVMYNALMNGAMVIARAFGDNINYTNHAVVVHGINENGELLIVNPSSASRDIGIYEAVRYALPVQNMLRDVDGAKNTGNYYDDGEDWFVIVTKKST